MLTKNSLCSLLGGLLALTVLSSCKTITTDPVLIGQSPITYQLVSDMVDEETIEYSVKFRNIGQQVVSFDYTIVDDLTVPHLDCLGPNSGLVENLYPGAEALVKNPMKSQRDAYVALGRLTYGKRTSEQLAMTYKPSTIQPAASASGGGLLPLPKLESLSAVGE
ncbi:hypothetical protein EI77_00128 [Prosthecobacter fusiformis]|uniref:Uncharacterized protein n=1 Tax=Prosthecobacter fusiformis TaxID=48464 RepID=A0A4R7SNR6_9BACT|nr:hypothetical protein [Prosthecobacter fusiformis]TDU80830.1 hypothetical protein EI77_00128 [Prosthecobacter fusiformis]